MDGMLKLLSQVVHTMLGNEPLLESILVLPLILKTYRWVLVACLLVAVVTFGVEMHNDYSVGTLLAPVNLALFAVQGVLLVAISAMVFSAKTYVLKALKITDPKAARPE